MKERRKVQRIRFAAPLEGRVRARKIAILDLGTDGACIQHALPLKSKELVELELSWNGEVIRAPALVTRCALSHVTPGPKGHSVHHSGLHFTGMDEESRDLLQSLIDEFIQRSLDESRDPGNGTLPRSVGRMPLDVWIRNKLK